MIYCLFKFWPLANPIEVLNFVGETQKSNYWMATNILHCEPEAMVVELSITKLQTFAWKISAFKKIYHFIWQLVTKYLAVTEDM